MEPEQLLYLFGARPVRWVGQIKVKPFRMEDVARATTNLYGIRAVDGPPFTSDPDNPGIAWVEKRCLTSNRNP